MSGRADWDVILAGGGLANGLIAYRLQQMRPELRVLLIEAGRVVGGNHTWSSHIGDISEAQQRWAAPFVSYRWPRYDVAFPGLKRRIDLGYCSITSERFADVLRDAKLPIRTGVRVEALTPTTVRLAGGETLNAAVVIDGRGDRASPHLRLAYQKFLGRDLRLTAPHGLTGPIVMDATVAQHDGYRFVYVLPFEPDRLLIEDTYYADTSALDTVVLRHRIEAYAAAKGWEVLRVLREEEGVLPITLTGDIDRFWATDPGQPRSGLRAGLFHPTTGYSFAEAVRLADIVASLPSLDAATVASAIEAQARRRWRDQRFFRGLNRMLFQAGRPEERWVMMQRFYRLPEPLVTRFYAGQLSMADKLRLLSGKPPVAVLPALRALMDHAP